MTREYNQWRRAGTPNLESLLQGWVLNIDTAMERAHDAGYCGRLPSFGNPPTTYVFAASESSEFRAKRAGNNNTNNTNNTNNHNNNNNDVPPRIPQPPPNPGPPQADFEPDPYEKQRNFFEKVRRRLRVYGIVATTTTTPRF